ncbi:helix-turn-helix domain-containing protein [Streptomyces lunaelactis]|nr:helix-turn-helix domain-containing protein [Streptomyces lunaelactis]NUL14984.1 helix-turn-helix domain-containing protein [Streptomyces lunaelactis]NUL22582.1 helix-turn-helix domain-containing protein [Streptomyces lunaelactis]
MRSDARATLRSGLPDRYLTPEDLADMLALPSVETVYSWRKKRIGPPGFRVGKHLRYDPVAVRDWIKDQMTADAA